MGSRFAIVLAMGMVGCFRRIAAVELSALVADPTRLDAVLGSGDSVDVDKAWAGIHYVLTGTADAGEWPWYDVVLGGNSIGDDRGYGPVRYHTAHDTAAIAQALSQITVDEFRNRFDPAAMTTADVYPAIWDQAWALDYVSDAYAKVKDCYAAAAAAGDAMLLWIS